MLPSIFGFAWLPLIAGVFVPIPTGEEAGGSYGDRTRAGQATPLLTTDTISVRESGGRCTARELSRTRLVVEGGRELYLEPKVFTFSGGRALLAGKPSYLFHPRKPNAVAEVESRHVVFGAVIEADGSARAVPAPPVNAGKVSAVAGIASEPGSWRVIFAELDSIATDSPAPVSFWHGIYDSTGWSAIERLPGPPGTPLLYYNSSRLTQNGDTVVWAAMSQVTSTRQGVVVFERRAGAWSHQVVTTPFTDDAELVHLPPLGFILAVVHRDTAIASDKKAVFLYTRRSGWQLHRRVASGEERSVLGVSIHASGGGGVLSWVSNAGTAANARPELRAMIGAIWSHDSSILVVDPSVLQGYASVPMSTGESVWVAGHDTGQGRTGELRLISHSNRSPAVLWRTPHPYLGPFAATAHSATDVLIVGPELDSARELLVSLILRLRVDCQPEPRPRG